MPRMKKSMRIHKIISSLLISSAVVGAGISAAADEDEDLLNSEATETDVPEAEDEAVVVADEAEEAEEADEEGDEDVPAAEINAPAGESFEAVAQTRRLIYKEAQEALNYINELISAGKIEEAEGILDDVEVALPKTPTSKRYLDQCEISRRDIEILKSESQIDTAYSLTAAERANVRAEILAARRLLERGRSLRTSHDLEGALKVLQDARRTLPILYSAGSVRQEINEEIALVYAGFFYNMVEDRSAVEAESYMKTVGELLGTNHKIYKQLNSFYVEWRKTPAAQNPKTLNPAFIRAEESGVEALRRAKAQYLYGDYHGALVSYNEALLYLPDSQEAKQGQIRIRKVLAASGELNRELLREVMFSDVSEKWRLAQPFTAVSKSATDEKTDPVVAKMSRINLPVSFRDAPLTRVIDTLGELSATYDPVGRGVDIVLVDQENKNNPPTVNVTMKDSSLTKVLDTILKSVGYRYDVKDGIVEVRPDYGGSDLDVQEFTLQPKVVNRMMAKKRSSNSGGLGSNGGSDSDDDADGQIIQDFFARAGVNWEGDRSLVYDASGNLLIVTQDNKGMERIRKIIQKLSIAETKQVNIEAKFIEVNSTALNEVAMNWSLTQGEGTSQYTRATTNNRTVADAHASVSSDSQTVIYSPKTITDDEGNITTTDADEYTVSQAAPQVTRQPNYGVNASPTFTGIIGTVGNYDLRFVLNALNALDGTDLMAAPSLTVQSEIEATIKIVQLLRWPQSYDDMEIQVSSSSSSSNSTYSYGSSSVGITPGTPQFDEDATEIGIQMAVTPRVNNDDNTITLELHPEIKEFEGFIEYGGTAVAISSGTVVTTPAGFFQPVFNLRQVTTTVEVYDGGTIVIGGLTREEVRTVNDKVPVLGDLPLIGAAFRSTGKSITKKNLLIFVTANLIARGGGTEEGIFRGVPSGATYSNPSLFISSGPSYRDYETATEETPDNADVK